MFYIGYIIMQLPATLYLKKVTARVQLSAALMAWGLFTTLFVSNSRLQRSRIFTERSTGYVSLIPGR